MKYKSMIQKNTKIKILMALPLLVFAILINGCAPDAQDDERTSTILTIYATLENSEDNRILVSPGDEFTVDISAMNLGNDSQFKINLLFNEGIEAIDDVEFDANIPTSQNKVFLRSVKFRAVEEGYYRIQVRAFGDNYLGAGSFWACVVSDTNNTKEVCTWDTWDY